MPQSQITPLGAIGQAIQALFGTLLEEEMRKEQRLFESSEREKQRKFVTSEREAGEAYGTTEREAKQDYATSERIAGQEYGTSERKAIQDYRTGERIASQDYATEQNLNNFIREFIAGIYGQRAKQRVSVGDISDIMADTPRGMDPQEYLEQVLAAAGVGPGQQAPFDMNEAVNAIRTLQFPTSTAGANQANKERGFNAGLTLPENASLRTSARPYGPSLSQLPTPSYMQGLSFEELMRMWQTGLAPGAGR